MFICDFELMSCESIIQFLHISERSKTREQLTRFSFFD